MTTFYEILEYCKQLELRVIELERLVSLLVGVPTKDEIDIREAVESELKKHGIVKMEIALRAIVPQIRRSHDGQLIAGYEACPLQQYVHKFLQENPELCH